MIVFISWFVSFRVSIQIQYSKYLCDVLENTPTNKISTWANQNKIKKSRKDYAVWTSFKFWPVKKIFRKL